MNDCCTSITVLPKKCSTFFCLQQIGPKRYDKVNSAATFLSKLLNIDQILKLNVKRKKHCEEYNIVPFSASSSNEGVSFFLFFARRIIFDAISVQLLDSKGTKPGCTKS